MATTSTVIPYRTGAQRVRRSAAVLAGRVLFSLIFILAGLNHFSKQTIAFAASDSFLRINGFYFDVIAEEGHEFIAGSMDRQEFRFAQILGWIREHIKKLT